MTADDYTTAAREEARRAWWDDRYRDMNQYPPLAFAQHMAEWARVYLSQQEPTDAKVLAALNADYAIRHPLTSPSNTLDDYGDWTVDIMRAALRAARDVRGQA